MVSTKFKPHSTYSVKMDMERAKIKRQYREARCKALKSTPPKVIKERRQS